MLTVLLVIYFKDEIIRNCTFSFIVFPRGRIHRRTWCMGSYAGVDYNLTFRPLQTPESIPHIYHRQLGKPYATKPVFENKLFNKRKNYDYKILWEKGEDGGGREGWKSLDNAAEIFSLEPSKTTANSVVFCFFIIMYSLTTVTQLLSAGFLGGPHNFKVAILV